MENVGKNLRMPPPLQVEQKISFFNFELGAPLIKVRTEKEQIQRISLASPGIQVEIMSKEGVNEDIPLFTRVTIPN